MDESKSNIAWTTIAQKCVETYNRTDHTITKFAPKYVLEGENVSILPEKSQTKCIDTDLKRDRKLALSLTTRIKGTLIGIEKNYS